MVVQDESAARDGRVIEVLGQYDPLKEPALFEVDKEKTQAWLSKGAEPTEKVRILLGKAGIMPPIDLAALPKRKPKAELKAAAEAEGEAKPAEEGKAEEKPAEEKPKEEAKAEEKPKAEAKGGEQPKEKVQEQAQVQESKEEQK